MGKSLTDFSHLHGEHINLMTFLKLFELRFYLKNLRRNEIKQNTVDQHQGPGVVSPSCSFYHDLFNQSINQSTNQSINRSIKYLLTPHKQHYIQRIWSTNFLVW